MYKLSPARGLRYRAVHMLEDRPISAKAALAVTLRVAPIEAGVDNGNEASVLRDAYNTGAPPAVPKDTPALAPMRLAHDA